MYHNKRHKNRWYISARIVPEITRTDWKYGISRYSFIFTLSLSLDVPTQEGHKATSFLSFREEFLLVFLVSTQETRAIILYISFHSLQTFRDSLPRLKEYLKFFFIIIIVPLCCNIYILWAYYRSETMKYNKHEAKLSETLDYIVWKMKHTQ